LAMPSFHAPRRSLAPRMLARPEAWLALGVLLFAGLYLAAIGPYWNISPDSVRYVGAARGLADGGFFEKLRFHPPVTSLVFAAVLLVFPDGYSALNATTTLLFILSLWFAYLLLRRTTTRGTCLLILVLSLASRDLFSESTGLLSEPVYMFASLLALVLLERSEEEGRSRLRELAGGGLLVAIPLTRTIGVTLVLAVLLLEGKALLSRRGGSPLVLALAGLGLLATVLWEVRASAPGMSGNFKMELLNDPWASGSGYTSPAGLVERILAHRGKALAIGAVLTGMLSTGITALDALLRAAVTLAFLAGLLIVLRQRVTVTGLYVLLYVAVVMVHVLKRNYEPSRHLVPILPLLFCYTIVGARAAARWITGRLGRRIAPLLAATAVSCVSVYLWHGFHALVKRVPQEHQSPFGSYPIKWSNVDGQRLALWLKHHSAPGEAYAAVHTNIYDLITERIGHELSPPSAGGSEAFAQWLSRNGIRFILLDRTDAGLQNDLLRHTTAQPGRFRLIAELPHASLYQVVPGEAGEKSAPRAPTA